MLFVPIIAAVFFALCFLLLLYKNINLKSQLNFANSQLESGQEEGANAYQEKIEYIQKIEQLNSKIKYQEQFTADFEKLRKESQEMTKAALFDLGNDLSKQLIEIHKKENNESRETARKNIEATAAKFNSEFERLVNMVGSLDNDIKQSKDTVEVIKNSLLSPSGAGKLAEITLENILKSSGLRNNVDFKMQYVNYGDGNSQLRPDAVIFLPSDNIMVIDAKASKFLVDDKDDMANLAKSMNAHLKSLSSKNYAENLMKNMAKKQDKAGNIITLMFLPTEHAIEKIMEADSKFMNKAWKENIFPVGPAGLMNMLSFSKFQISEQMMLQNYQYITAEVKKIISSISAMAYHSDKLGNSISSVVGHYDKFAASFNRNFLAKISNINKLGIDIKASRSQLPLKRYQLVSSQSEMIDVEPKDSKKSIPIEAK